MHMRVGMHMHVHMRETVRGPLCARGRERTGTIVALAGAAYILHAHHLDLHPLHQVIEFDLHLVKPSRVKPNRVESSQVQINPNQDKSGQVKSGQVTPGQVRSGQVRSGQVKSRQVRSSRI